MTAWRVNDNVSSSTFSHVLKIQTGALGRSSVELTDIFHEDI